MINEKRAYMNGKQLYDGIQHLARSPHTVHDAFFHGQRENWDSVIYFIQILQNINKTVGQETMSFSFMLQKKSSWAQQSV